MTLSMMHKDLTPRFIIAQKKIYIYRPGWKYFFAVKLTPVLGVRRAPDYQSHTVRTDGREKAALAWTVNRHHHRATSTHTHTLTHTHIYTLIRTKNNHVVMI